MRNQEPQIGGAPTRRALGLRGQQTQSAGAELYRQLAAIKRQTNRSRPPQTGSVTSPRQRGNDMMTAASHRSSGWRLPEGQGRSMTSIPTTLGPESLKSPEEIQRQALMGQALAGQGVSPD